MFLEFLLIYGLSELFKQISFQNFKFFNINLKFFAKIALMRVDKFLNAVNITKRRAVAEDMCKSGVVFINETLAKPAKAVKIGDIITLKLNAGEQKYKILALPILKNIPKNTQNEYVEKL